MQAQDLFPQVQRLVLAEQLTLLNFLVQLIQQEVVLPERGPDAWGSTTTGLVKPVDTESVEIGPQTVLERMGGMPQHLLSVGGLSDRDRRRQLVAERIQTRYRTSP
jgi:hypothetical protein